MWRSACASLSPRRSMDTQWYYSGYWMAPRLDFSTLAWDSTPLDSTRLVILSLCFFHRYMKCSRCSNSCSADDKASNHTFHSAVGNNLPEEKIQVINEIWLGHNNDEYYIEHILTRTCKFQIQLQLKFMCIQCSIYSSNQMRRKILEPN